MKERSTQIKAAPAIDVHVHTRLNQPHKQTIAELEEDTKKGGVEKICAMPNDQPTVDAQSVKIKNEILSKELSIDHAIYLGANNTNYNNHKEVFHDVIALKIYMNETTGPLLIEDPYILDQHFKNWPDGKPICVHAEGETLITAITLAKKYNNHLHVCHVSQAMQVDLIQQAKNEGMNITAEVTPHHLLLTELDAIALGGFGRMKPPLETQEDQDALWRGIQLGIIDMVATDHAPHTREEKLSDSPPYGVPGLKTMLPLMFYVAIHEKRLSLEDVNKLTVLNPARIFKIKNDYRNSSVTIDTKETYTINDPDSPFNGHGATKILQVKFDGLLVYDGEQVLPSSNKGKRIIQTT